MFKEIPDLPMHKIVSDVLRKAAEEAVRSVLAEHAGYGIDTEIKNAIKEQANRIVQEKEIQSLIRKQLVHWIERA